jgi:MoxR-like ATPase
MEPAPTGGPSGASHDSPAGQINRDGGVHEPEEVFGSQPVPIIAPQSSSILPTPDYQANAFYGNDGYPVASGPYAQIGPIGGGPFSAPEAGAVPGPAVIPVGPFSPDGSAQVDGPFSPTGPFAAGTALPPETSPQGASSTYQPGFIHNGMYTPAIPPVPDDSFAQAPAGASAPGAPFPPTGQAPAVEDPRPTPGSFPPPTSVPMIPFDGQTIHQENGGSNGAWSTPQPPPPERQPVGNQPPPPTGSPIGGTQPPPPNGPPAAVQPPPPGYRTLPAGSEDDALAHSPLSFSPLPDMSQRLQPNGQYDLKAPGAEAQPEAPPRRAAAPERPQSSPLAPPTHPAGVSMPPPPPASAGASHLPPAPTSASVKMPPAPQPPAKASISHPAPVPLPVEPPQVAPEAVPAPAPAVEASPETRPPAPQGSAMSPKAGFTVAPAQTTSAQSAVLAPLHGSALAEQIEPRIDDAIALGQALVDNLRHVVLGTPGALTAVAVAALSGGHLLIEDVPGVGKTVLAQALAASLGTDLSRLQGHPDLLPSDVTGVSVFSPETGDWEFKPGPVFAHVVLFDELNRTPPRTQAALLEAMEEHQVSADGESWHLPIPHLVVATQNPHSQLGTYPLVESQLDRFALATAVGYPDAEVETQIVLQHGGRPALPDLRPVCTPMQWYAAQLATQMVNVEEPVAAYAVALCRGSRAAAGVRLGASPRAAIWLVRTAQAHAVLSGRSYVTPGDVKAMALSCLSHRLTTDEGVAYGVRVVRALLDSTPAPRP